MILQKVTSKLLLSLIALTLFEACTKKDIQFGTDLGETYTGIIQVDTIGIDMSTYVVDSFATNNVTEFLFGRYKDPIFGTITAKPFLQLALPTDITMQADAVYDSLSFVIKLNKYYYGDTSKPVTITINELAAPIEYTYSNHLYNTSSIAEKPTPLGLGYLKVRPSTDSVMIKLNDEKGLDLFNKLKESKTEIQTVASFIDYFKGVSIGFSSSNDGAAYGFNSAADSIFMRLNYHTSIPYPEKKFKDFKFNKGTYFNQLVTDRSTTPLASAAGKIISSTLTGNHAYTQAGTGVLLKMIFPSLRNILQLSSTVKLVKATLVLKISNGTYDGKYQLPPALFLTETSATNAIGSYLSDSSGSVLYSLPTSDYVYGSGTYYYFNLTSYINSLLTTSVDNGNGFFVMDNSPGTSTTINRALINNSAIPGDGSKLILSLLTLKN